MFKYKKITLIITAVLVFFSNSFMYAESINDEEVFIKNGSRDKKLIALTFDDGPHPKETNQVLDVLNKYNVKGTFFIMGGWINYTDDNKEKLKNIYNDGHEIGNHSYIHPNFVNITEERMNDELQKTEDIIYETIGCNTKLFRFPSGSYNEKALNYVLSKGYKCIQWDVDSVDWKQSGADVEYNRVMKNVKAGSILLFHNNAKYTPEN